MKKITSPERLSPSDLDEALHGGWFRINQTLISCGALVTDRGLCSTVWTRTDLRGYSFKASLRRVMRRVEERFSVSVARAQIDDEHEEIYQRYLTSTEGSRSPSVRQFLYGHEPDRGLFDTWEVALREGGRLVAFSLFDLGSAAMQSLLGAYDPAHARYGLGLYTLLREIAFGIEAGLRYHYAGYVLIGDPLMDYKLRAGRIELLDDRTGQWLPWDTLASGLYTPPVERQRAALLVALAALEARGVEAELRTNTMFELPAHVAELSMCLNQPLYIECFASREGRNRVLVLWDPEREAYSLVHAVRATVRARSKPEEDIDLLAELARHPAHTGLDEVIDAIVDVSGASDG